jgi:putative PIN family toxin of toxin-antitoxin system
MTEPERWVLDTNTLVSRLLLPSGIAAKAVDKVLCNGVVLVSEATLDELVSVINRPKFDAYITDEERKQFIRLLGGVARMVKVVHTIKACRDAKDDKFLDVALTGNATGILTGDKDLLALHPFHDIKIIGPAAYLAVP